MSKDGINAPSLLPSQELEKQMEGDSFQFHSAWEETGKENIIPSARYMTKLQEKIQLLQCILDMKDNIAGGMQAMEGVGL